MTQLLYGLMALVVVMLFTIFITSAGLTGEQEMYLTEARTRMLGVARETAERLTTLELPFDYATDPDRGASGQTFPYVNSAAQLTGGDSFGGCNPGTVQALSSCLDIDDVHGVSLTDSAGGLPVTVGFEVAYVDSLGQHSASQTYAKEVTVEVRTHAIMIAGDSLRVRYSRAFVYPSTVDFARSVAAAP